MSATRTWTLLAGAILALAPGSHGAVTVGALVPYQLTATLDDGALLTGTFVLDLSVPDSSSTANYGRFEILSHDLLLTQSNLFAGATQGSSTGLVLVQQARFSPSEQSLYIDFVADGGGSGVFGVIDFQPFSGPADIAGPIQGTPSGGYLDGGGVAYFTTVDLQVIPEPATFELALLGAATAVLRRRRVVASKQSRSGPA